MVCNGYALIVVSHTKDNHIEKVKDLENENEKLQDENNALDLQNDNLREEIEKLEDALHEIE